MMKNGKKKLSITDRQMDRAGHRVACTRLKLSLVNIDIPCPTPHDISNNGQLRE